MLSPAAAPPPAVAPAIATAIAAAAPLPAAVTETITARSAGAQLVATEAKPFRQYAFTIEASGVPGHTLTGRFSSLQKTLRCAGGGGGGRAVWKAVSGSFPSTHPFRDFTNNEANVARRAEELRAYLERLLADNGDEGQLISDPGFQATALQLQPGAALGAALGAIGAARRQRAEQARAAEAARLAAIAAEQAGDCAFAQTFNQVIIFRSHACQCSHMYHLFHAAQPARPRVHSRLSRVRVSLMCMARLLPTLRRPWAPSPPSRSRGRSASSCATRCGASVMR